jgi:hypothetical protein
MPHLRVLDFQKIKLKEKVMAKQLFESEKGQQIIEEIKANKFKSEDNDEYRKALEKTLQDEQKKKMLYVNYIIIYIL